MVNLVLYDLCREAGIGLEPRFKALVLKLHLDRTETLGLSCSGEGQSALLRFISPRAFYNLRV